jgi:hypothetical protein
MSEREASSTATTSSALLQGRAKHAGTVSRIPARHPGPKRRNISATIIADVKRFCHEIKTDEVFRTHRAMPSGLASTRQNWLRSPAMSSRLWGANHWAFIAGDPHLAYHVRAGRRSSRSRLRYEPWRSPTAICPFHRPDGLWPNCS